MPDRLSSSDTLSEPNFFLVGAPKCGTTALFDYLFQHPNVFCSDPKEPNYFATDFPSVQGPDHDAAYLDLFKDATETHQARGEASVVYMYSHAAIAAIRTRYPDARLIIMVRNPVDMVYSYHSQMLNTANESVTDFETAWRLQEARASGQSIPRQCLEPAFLQYAKMARFSQHIGAVLEHFSAQQVHIILFDDLKADPQAVFNGVTDHLGVPRCADIDFRVVNANRVQRSNVLAGMTERPAPKTIRRVLGPLKRALGLESFGLRNWLAQINMREAPRAPLAPEFRRELQVFFADEVSALEQLTGRDLSAWRE